MPDSPDDAAFDPDQPTPTEFLPEPHPPRSQEDIDREQLVSQGKRLAELEKRVAELEASFQHSGLDRLQRQVRYLRRYLISWVAESRDEEPAGQLRRLRRYFAVWMKED